MICRGPFKAGLTLYQVVANLDGDRNCRIRFCFPRWFSYQYII